MMREWEKKFPAAWKPCSKPACNGFAFTCSTHNC